MRALILIGITLLTLSNDMLAQQRTSPKNQREELGKVSWYRDYFQALDMAKKQNKPVFILFQEVPGCATCSHYGKAVLSQPLMVEAIENEFVPLAIYNNKGGDDAQILKRYKEPSWNNPVVRIVDSDGLDVVSRVSGNYTLRGLYDAMEQALIKQQKPIPGYMDVLDDEIILAGNRGLKTDYFKMYCFWTGEKRLGEADGVLATETGFIGGSEVVKVKYDPSLLSEQALTKYAQNSNCKPIENRGNYRRSSKDHYFQIRNTPYKYLPLSGIQKTKINSSMGSNVSPELYLSPRQKQWLAQLNDPKIKKKEFIDIPFQRAWEMRRYEH